MKTYELEFTEDALKEWRKLGEPVRRQFAEKLEERLSDPHIPSAKLGGWPDCYKIKLRTVGYWLVYRVLDDVIIVQVIVVGRRDKNDVYRKAASRLHH